MGWHAVEISISIKYKTSVTYGRFKLKAPVLARLSKYRSIETDWFQQHEGACGVMVIVVGNKHSDPSSNPGRGILHFT